MPNSVWSFVPLKWTNDSSKMACAVAVFSATIVVAYSKMYTDQEQRKRKMLESLTRKYGKRTVVMLALTKTSKNRLYHSPFFIKMEIFLRVNKIRYATQCGDLSFTASPWIFFNGRVYDDTDEAISDISIQFSLKMNTKLSIGDQAISRAFQMMLEHHLYWLFLINRWVHEKGRFMWEFVPEDSSWLTRFLMGRMIRSVAGKMEALTGSHSLGMKAPEKILQSAIADIQSVEDFLQSKPFLMGSSVSLVDCSAFAFLYLLRGSDLAKSTNFPKIFPNCQAYVDRMSKLVSYS